MKEILSQYAAYNLWANQKLITLVLGLDESKQDELDQQGKETPLDKALQKSAGNVFLLV